MSLLQYFIDDSASQDADADAFQFRGESLTYAALVAQANRIANILMDHGLRRMDRVGILMSKRLELPATVYGILKAGGVFVPIDTTAPPSRIKFMIQDCGIRHLITEPSKESLVRQIASECQEIQHVIGIDGSGQDGIHWDSWQTVAQLPAEHPVIASTEQDLAYIMYTSGSTGAPKGLMHTHASGISYARISARTYQVGPDDRLGNHAALHFDQSTFEYFTGPKCGATTVLIPEEEIMFPISLGKLIEREKLTFWYSVPLTLIRLLQHGGIETIDASTLRWVLFGGEAFPPKYLWRLMALWPQARFSNCYGPAEVNQCTYFHVPPDRIGSDEALPIGKLWEDTDGLVVGSDDGSVAPGEAGELLVRTPTMMQGYWGRPDLNESAFLVRERFPGYREVFYRTGDLVRFDAQGQLHFLGRKDRQIKVRGYRVELDEVENVFCSFDEVAESAAFSVSSDEGAIEVEVAVLLQKDAAVNSNQLRQAASKVLPPYAVPKRVNIHSEFPRTTSGKIDRSRLKEERPLPNT